MLLSLIASLAVAGEKPPKVVKIVKIEGVSYKVRQRGNEATVARQAMVVNANTRHFSMAKRAAEIATNCTVVETFPIVDLLNVSLDCTKPPAPAEPAIEVRENE